MRTAWSVKNVKVSELIALIDSCKGNVYLVTDEGDKLNLKSKLCQLIGLSKLVQDGIIANASLVCDNIDDESKLVRYKLYGELPADVKAEVETEVETEVKSETADAKPETETEKKNECDLHEAV